MKVAVTPIRVVCNNTLNLALNTAKRRFSMIHTGNIHDKIQEAQEIRVRADGVFQVKKHDVTKNYDVKQAGIAVVKEGTDIGPCVYLDGSYREYESGGMKFGENVDEVYRLILQHGEDVPDVDISGFLNWETVHGDIRAKLINAE